MLEPYLFVSLEFGKKCKKKLLPLVPKPLDLKRKLPLGLNQKAPKEHLFKRQAKDHCP